MKVFYFENSDGAVRAGSSAGGFFTALAEKILTEGGVVYGAAFDDSWEVVHTRVDRPKALEALRGSKYVFTDISGCFSSIADDLKAGRDVMFCGTPCQVAAIRKRVGENENLLLIEVVCHGAPQPKYWDLYLDEILLKQGKSREDIASINFRDKTEGWKNYSVRVDFKDGSHFIQRHGDNPYILTFIYDYTLRDGCSKCPFKNPNSKADISMGDFWGIEVLTPEIDNNLGTTILIADTSKGEALLSEMAESTSLSVEEVGKYNPAILKAPNTPWEKAEFEKLVSEKGFLFAANKVIKPILKHSKPALKSRIKSIIYRSYS
ncbi:MAG: Coenzyme F420 hydrogenase/dehydrogenase, beta subunit C-terminal domain, partial [Muribaculaceae bacterium]|nr:Coenzyme F420 hydrogenase/dehydrogenase, beta subunit C-terminal domain [Muribaculaceae bacterium]